MHPTLMPILMPVCARCRIARSVDDYPLRRHGQSRRIGAVCQSCLDALQPSLAGGGRRSAPLDTPAAGGEKTRDLPLFGDEKLTDTGCEIAPRCLSCPLPACRFDSGQAKAIRTGIRHAAETARVRKLLAAGQEPANIALVMGISVRTVFRRKRVLTSGQNGDA